MNFFKYKKQCDIGGDQLKVTGVIKDEILSFYVKNSNIQYSNEVEYGESIKYKIEFSRIDTIKFKSLLRKIVIKYNGSKEFGADGYTYCLSYGLGMDEIKVKWWHDIPKEWEGVVELVDWINLQVDKNLPNKRMHRTS